MNPFDGKTQAYVVSNIRNKISISNRVKIMLALYANVELISSHLRLDISQASNALLSQRLSYKAKQRSDLSSIKIKVNNAMMQMKSLRGEDEMMRLEASTSSFSISLKHLRGKTFPAEIQ